MLCALKELLSGETKKVFTADSSGRKAIGEAIAATDFFLLFWSKSAADSHFVEFEWNTAVALRKTIIPCLLDDTPLPPLLRGTHSINVLNLQEAMPRLLSSLQAHIPELSSRQHSSEVITNSGT